MRLVLDTRIPSRPVYHLLGEKESLMRIPDDLQKCVAFVQYKDASGDLKFGGTAFFVCLPMSDIPGGIYSYAVTAHHVIHNIRKLTTDSRVYLRLNFRNAKAQPVSTPIHRWYTHPTDDSVDIAVVPFAMNVAWDHLPYPVASFADEACISKKGVGMGDEVFLMGLFVHHRATERNTPIVRIGNIAAMPEEPIRTYGKYFDEMEAYLIETRSIAGLSGSPVFVNLQGARNVGKGTVITVTGGTYGGFHLLGLVHGHWGQEAPDINPTTKDVKLHTGISIVVPAKKIIEVINHPELIIMREREEVEFKEKHAATMDSSTEEKEPEKPFTKADFEDALKKVSRTEESDDKN